jgi:hypothetical protein
LRGKDATAQAKTNKGFSERSPDEARTNPAQSPRGLRSFFGSSPVGLRVAIDPKR